MTFLASMKWILLTNASQAVGRRHPDASCSCYPDFGTNVTCPTTSVLLATAALNGRNFAIRMTIISYFVAILGLIVNMIFIVILSHLIRRRLIPWKRHGILVSLASGHILYSGLMLVLTNIKSHKVESGENYGYWYSDVNLGALFSIVYLAYAQPFVDYVAMCLLQCYALVKPFEYRLISVKQFLLIILATTFITAILGTVLVACYWLVLAACIGPPGRVCMGKNYLGIRMTVDPTSIMTLVLYCVAGITLVICYTSVKLAVDRRKKRLSVFTLQKNSSERKRVRSIRRTVTRLGVNVIVYICTLTLVVVARIYSLFEEHHMMAALAQLKMGFTGIHDVDCSVVEQKERIILDSGGRLDWVLLVECLASLRMVVEPLFHITCNKKIRLFVAKTIFFSKCG